jgi:RNA polymerase sigma-70 factor (ECF subfamily)
MELIKNLFRSESGKITTVLARYFGFEHLQIAEDIVMDTFVSALETWPYKGLPSNPTAWLYAVAKNKASNEIKRNQLFRNKIQPGLANSDVATISPEIDLSPANIEDSQLQMLFAICHPSLSQEGRVGLALRILCGFGIDEIASAFRSNRDTINKRLYRARRTLRDAKILVQLTPSEISGRLDDVLTTLYLLFNEGYYSETNDEVIRKDLCLEALKLTYFLTTMPLSTGPRVKALLALMCFHTSRIEARTGVNGELILYDDQDKTKWNRELISRGAQALQEAAQGSEYSRYHLEAGIAYWHTVTEPSGQKWEQILQLYNRLLQLAYSPMAALNRTYALFRARGRDEAIRAAALLPVKNNPYYHLLLGELYKGVDNKQANKHFRDALALSKTSAEKAILHQKINPATES